MANDKMRIWDALGKTDPKHTKQFTRAGGFKGTAIKPMWANMQLTEYFGPCGIGWGQEKPEFTTVEAAGEILVYCTVCLWYLENDAMTNRVYGVGGDKVVSQIFLKDSRGQKIPDEAKGGYKTYPQTDDEAFKKAYTDALSNAMKFIGVAADVHMGLFDDSKYVQEVGKEFEKERAEVFAEVERQKATAKQVDIDKAIVDQQSIAAHVLPPELDWSYNKSSGVLICRPVEAKTAKKKDGKEFVAVKLNNPINGKDVASYFHNSFKAELLASAGKVCKFSVVEKGAFANIDAILEIDGKRMVDDSAETQARLMASVMNWDEEELRELHTSQCGASWPKTLEALQRTKAMAEGV